MTAGTGQLDTAIEVVTPENISFRYRLAGPFRRLCAYLVDFVVRVLLVVIVFWFIAYVASWMGLNGSGMALRVLVFFLVSWFYGGILETYWNGQTVGKRALGIRVLSIDGRPINAMQAVMRNVLREADMLPVLVLQFPPIISLPIPTYLFGLAAVTTNRRFQRLGDLACGTMVVTDERTWLASLARVDDPAAIQLAAAIPPSFVPSRTLREALAGYVERRRYFPALRRADIARHVGAPLCRRLGLAPDTSHDLLLCALYYRTFVADGERIAAEQGLGVPPSTDLRTPAVRAPQRRPLARVP